MSKKQRQYGAEAKEAGGSDLKRFYWIIGIVGVLGLGIVGYSVMSRSVPAPSQPVALPVLDDPNALMSMTRGVVKGNESAPITIMEFGDFQCPACGEFFQTVEPALVAEFVNTGRAKFVFYDFPLTQLHPNAFLASRAGHCAEDQQKFWEYHDHLYMSQGRWSSLPSPADEFEEYAGALGLDQAAFRECLRSDRHVELVSANLALATQLQAPGTPTILVSPGGRMGRMVPSTLEGIREAVESYEAAP